MKRSSMLRLPLVMAVLLGMGCGYNTIQTMDERVNQAQGQIQTQLQRRADLIPNLVNTVKGITKQEDTVFISIANARARLGGPESRLWVARKDYNTAVGEYNAYTRRFPYNLTAKVFGMGKPREYFEAAPGAAEAPKVSF